MSTSTLTLEQVQRALARKAKQAERDEKRNAEIKVKYPFAQNVRSSTDEERLTLKKDLVADCKCECCDKMFVVAVQDLWHGKPKAWLIKQDQIRRSHQTTADRQHLLLTPR